MHNTNIAVCGARKLCADWIMQETLPAYARHFHPGRYSDPVIMKEIEQLESDGQL